MPSQIKLQPGTLWNRVITTTEQALISGALLSIPTDCEIMEDEGVNFVVRILSNLTRKNQAKQKTPPDFNPFLPYEQNLWVADVSDTHVCILNKFNVVEHHLLIITRDFESQESLLTADDFIAMHACLADFDGLAFYNSGQIAGASQKHKHLQIVPFSINENNIKVPIEPLLASANFQDGVGTVEKFPFIHAFAKLNHDTLSSPTEAGKATWEIYQNLLRVLNHNSKPSPYNLLATREWILIVTRSHEEYKGISINSLGFAGNLLVGNLQQLELLKQYRPMQILQQVAFPRS
ncbi:ATP adenylyltransferase family protein [Calothrix sp. PCC 6303]|uniref:ATP adenylyltransferase family protein n=1 Tax=Calothrix sp. PCC 6303 TaxID=1170562 RepID=UPI0002A0035F|nr:ATP adenylyltransferase [Calothrix sp. PCC 6303]AFZ00206.1 ATP adenylyltransferase [Calothrix sp. PCC 6303]